MAPIAAPLQVPRRTARGRGAGGLAATFALFALLVHVLVPLGQAVPKPSSAADLPSGFRVVCTASESTRPLPRDGRQPADGQRSSCPVCLLGALGALLLPPAAIGVETTILGAEAVGPPAPEEILTEVLVRRPVARAPPVIL